MKIAVLCGATVILMNAAALSQTGSDVLSACSLPSYAERMRCLERLSGDVTPPPSPLAAAPAPEPSPAPASRPAVVPPPASPSVADVPAAPTVAATTARPPSKWVLSETRSPVDYSPIAIATTSAETATNGVMQLSIQCRGGRTEIVLRSAPMMPRAEDHIVSYRINAAPPVAVTPGPSSSGGGIALKVDVAGLLMSLPAEGTIVFRVADRQGGSLEGQYDLPGIKALVARMAGPCKWPRK